METVLEDSLSIARENACNQTEDLKKKPVLQNKDNSSSLRGQKTSQIIKKYFYVDLSKPVSHKKKVVWQKKEQAIENENEHPPKSTKRLDELIKLHQHFGDKKLTIITAVQAKIEKQSN